MGSDFESQINKSTSSRSSSYSSCESSSATTSTLTGITEQQQQSPISFLFAKQCQVHMNNNLNSKLYYNTNDESLENSLISGSPNNTFPNSCSQIFATAASFHISQNDTVMFARETIHLLAKFLANHSECTIFRSLYAYAPDNLAWLWAFIDWESSIDFKRSVPVQDKYEPFRWSPSGNQLVQLSPDNEEFLSLVNKTFADSPLIQYKYREKVMIGDLCKFIEHIHKISDPVIAKSLFLLYFPRFGSYIDNPLNKYLNVKILATNMIHVQELDNMILKLIRTRYNDLNEYKQKILTRSNLPSYVDSLVYDNGDFLSNPRNKNILLGLINDVQFQKKLRELNSLNLSQFKLAPQSTPALGTSMLNTFNEQASNNSTSCNNSSFFGGSSLSQLALAENNQGNAKSNTSIYMKRLGNVRINKDLDHNSDLDILSASSCYNDSEETANCYNSTASSNQQQQQPTTQSMVIFEGGLDDDDEVKRFLLNNEANANLFSRLTLNCKPPLSGSSKPSHSNESQGCSNTTTKNNFQFSPPSFHVSNIQERSHSSASSGGRSTSALVSPTPSFQYSAHMTACSTTQSCTGGYLDTPKTPSSVMSPVSHHYQQFDNEFANTWSNGKINNINNQQQHYYSKNQHQQQHQVITPPPSATMPQPNLSLFSTSQLNGSISCSQRDSGNNSQSMFISPMMNKSGDVSEFIRQQQQQNNYENLNDHLMNGLSPQQQEDIQIGRQIAKQYNSSLLTSPGFQQQQYKMSDFNSAEYVPYSNIADTNPVTNQHQQQQQRSITKYNSNATYSSDKNNNGGYKSPSNSSNSSSNRSTNSYFSSSSSRSSSNSMHTEWCGRLPPKIYAPNSVYSRKVFLGGLPWDVNQSFLLCMLQQYGQVKLEIPGKDLKHPRVSTKTQERNTPGYIYVIYENEASVQRLLANCRRSTKNGGEHFYYTISVPTFNSNNNNNNNGGRQNNMVNGGGRMPWNSNGNGVVMSNVKAKEVEVIPWNQEDTSYVPQFDSVVLPSKIDSRSTIFVGALHGMLNAQGLAKVMNEVFGEVIHAGLDTDKYKYPIGSGRVTFRHRSSYVKAIKSKFVSIKANQEPNDPSPKFEKTIQIDPYLEDAKCCKCQLKSQLFCRNELCLDYYCQVCWNCNHDKSRGGEHNGLSRQNKTTNHF